MQTHFSEETTESKTTHSKTTGFFLLMLLASAYGTSHSNPSEITEVNLPADLTLSEKESSTIPNPVASYDTPQEEHLSKKEKSRKRFSTEETTTQSSWSSWSWWLTLSFCTLGLAITAKGFKLLYNEKQVKKQQKINQQQEIKQSQKKLKDLLEEWDALEKLQTLATNYLEKSTSKWNKALYEQIVIFIQSYSMEVAEHHAWLLNIPFQNKVPFNKIHQNFKETKKNTPYTFVQSFIPYGNEDQYKKYLTLANKIVEFIYKIQKKTPPKNFDSLRPDIFKHFLNEFKPLSKFLEKQEEEKLLTPKPALEKPHVPIAERFDQDKKTFDEKYEQYAIDIESLRSLYLEIKKNSPKNKQFNDSTIRKLLQYDPKKLEQTYHEKPLLTEDKLLQLKRDIDFLTDRLLDIQRSTSKLKNRKKVLEDQKEKSKEKDKWTKTEKPSEKEQKPPKTIKKPVRSMPPTFKVPLSNSPAKTATTTKQSSVSKVRTQVAVPAPTSAPTNLFNPPPKHQRIEDCEKVFNSLSMRFEDNVENIPDETHTEIVILLKALITDWGIHYRLPGRRGQFRDNLIYDLEIILEKKCNNNLTKLWKTAREYYDLSSGTKYSTQIESHLIKEINQLRYTTYQDEKLNEFNKPFHEKRADEIKGEMVIIAQSQFLTVPEKSYLTNCLLLLRDKHRKIAGDPTITEERRKAINMFSHPDPHKLFTSSSTSQSSSGSTSESTGSSLPWKKWWR